jgi:predicted Zn-dependent protease with MMP-like domain
MIDPDNNPFSAARHAARQAQSPRSFLVFLGVVIGILALGFSLFLQLDTFTRILALLGTGGLILVGITLLDKGKIEDGSDLLPPQDTDNEPHELLIDEQPAPDAEEQDDDDTLTPFELLVQEALDSIPEEFHQEMDNLMVIVEQEPDAKTLAQVGTREGETLLGLYSGVPLTHACYQYAMFPELITIYQQTIEHYCGHDPDRIREQVRSTVLHEIAHHFGMDHEEMPIWIK